MADYGEILEFLAANPPHFAPRARAEVGCLEARICAAYGIRFGKTADLALNEENFRSVVPERLTFAHRIGRRFGGR